MKEEQVIFEDIMEDRGAVLTETFMHNLVINAHGKNKDKLHMFDVVYKDVLDDDEKNMISLISSNSPTIFTVFVYA